MARFAAAVPPQGHTTARHVAVTRIVALAAALLAVLMLGAVAHARSENANWQQRFKEAIDRDQEVRLGGWDKIFLLESYDLNAPMQVEVFGAQQLYTFWWDQNPNYWTIIYRRPKRSPFIIRMTYGEWGLHRRTFVWSKEGAAKLRRVIPGTKEASECSARLRACLILEDSRRDYGK